MIEWIEAGLPFSRTPTRDEDIQYPKSPNLDEEMRAVFGQTFEDTHEIADGPLRKEYSKEMDVLMEEVEDDGQDPYEILPNSWLNSGDAERVIYAGNVLLRRSMRTWETQHPATLAYRKAWDTARLAGTFAGLGLVRPGVQVEMGDGKKLLIGDINQLRGVCDDCTEFDAEDIVVRYRVLIPEEMLS